MRFLLSALLGVFLAVNMVLASLGAEQSPPDQHATATIAPGVVQIAHDCCPEPQDMRHGTCAICLAVHQAEAMPLDARSPRSVQHFPLRRAEKSVALRLPLRPPQRAAV